MKDNREETRELRRFGQVTGLAAAIVFGLLLPWLFGREYRWWPWCLALVLWLLAYAYPLALRPVSRAWLRVGHWLGWVNTRLILGVMYYTMFLVTGLVMRLLGKDPMARKLDGSVESYRTRSRVREKNHVERPF